MQTNSKRLLVSSLLSAAAALGVVAPNTAAAVDATRASIGIWDTRQPNAQGVFGGVRLAPAATAQLDAELPAPANGCSQNAVDANGMITAVRKRRVVMRNGDMTVEGTYDTSVTSLPFPAFGNASATGASFYREDAGQVTQSAKCTSFPYDRRQGGGVATLATGTKVRVFGIATVGSYYKAATGNVNIGRYAVYVFNIGGVSRTGYPKSWVASDATTGWNIDPTLSGVADFLGSDGADELRVALYKDVAADATHPNGTRTWSYQFYSLADGSLIVKRDITVANP